MRISAPCVGQYTIANPSPARNATTSAPSTTARNNQAFMRNTIAVFSGSAYGSACSRRALVPLRSKDRVRFSWAL
ncbi:hypothetical protein IFM12275_02710 [Nocardia sputorum]|uniref:Uncharacterized protein n=1 Tax=Nocardia sputorum TaxID=2984338 RepID=A0ABN6U170_9NOCA|nr:hypothetical protein IFM12275_02710 [Nocardia sputorum]BDT98915.1 hypothetical protein IFM12276_19440 [Nocardia sputorum]